MFTVIASVLAGLGLFFVGLKLLTENLKLLSGRRLRESIAGWTRNPLMGVLWGGLFIAITQSAAAATFILIGMQRAGMLPVRQVLPILIGVNMIGGLIVMVLIFDVKLAVFLLLGITGLMYSRDKATGLRAVAGAAFGVGMLFLGLSTTQAGVEPLTNMPWFLEALQSTRGSFVLGFLAGAAFAFITQSGLAVVILTLAFMKAGLFSLEQAVMIAYGTKLGSAFLTAMLSSGLTGESRRIAAFQVAFNLIGVAILVPAFYIEVVSDVPLMMALAGSIAEQQSMQLALVNLMFNFVPALIIFPILGPVASWLARRYPETAEEKLSKPRYLLEHTGEDAHNALGLIELEQVRLIEILGRNFEAMANPDEGTPLASLDEAFQTLATSIREAFQDISNQGQLSPVLYDRLNALLNLQHALEAANGECHNLAHEITSLADTDIGDRFGLVAINGVETILLTLQDVALNRDALDLQFLDGMTSEEGMSRVRKAYLAESNELASTTRMRLLAAANHCERLIWLFGDMGKTYRLLSD